MPMQDPLRDDQVRSSAWKQKQILKTLAQRESAPLAECFTSDLKVTFDLLSIILTLQLQ